MNHVDKGEPCQWKGKGDKGGKEEKGHGRGKGNHGMPGFSSAFYASNATYNGVPEPQYDKADAWLHEIESMRITDEPHRRAADDEGEFARIEGQQAYCSMVTTSGGPPIQFCMTCGKYCPDGSTHWYSRLHLKKVQSKPYTWQDQWLPAPKPAGGGASQPAGGGAWPQPPQPQPQWSFSPPAAPSWEATAPASQLYATQEELNRANAQIKKLQHELSELSSGWSMLQDKCDWYVWQWGLAVVRRCVPADGFQTEQCQ